MIYILSKKNSYTVFKNLMSIETLFQLEFNVYEVIEKDCVYYITEVRYSLKDKKDVKKLLSILYTQAQGTKEYCLRNDVSKREISECLKDTIYMGPWDNIEVKLLTNIKYIRHGD